MKVEAQEFRKRLDDVRKELEDLEREAERGTPKPRRAKDDYQIWAALAADRPRRGVLAAKL